MNDEYHITLYIIISIIQKEILLSIHIPSVPGGYSTILGKPSPFI